MFSAVKSWVVLAVPSNCVKKAFEKHPQNHSVVLTLKVDKTQLIDRNLRSKTSLNWKGEKYQDSQMENRAQR